MRSQNLLLQCVLALALTLLAPGAAKADWVNDEAFLRKLRAHLKELKISVAIFERHRRSLDMVEASISSLDLGLAAPDKEPRKIIQGLMKTSFPRVRWSIKRLASSKHKGIKTWRWRLTQEGSPDDLLAATVRLQKSGMFILPGALEQLRLTRGTGPKPWKLSLVGHHVRLRDLSLKPLPKIKGSDAFVRRTDPPALKIKKILKEISALRKRIAYIQQFEARINEIKRFLHHLRMLSNMARNPVPEVELARRMELIHVSGVVHEGSRVTVSGEVHSPIFRKAALRWLERHSTPQLRYKASTLGLRWSPVGRLPELAAPPRGAARGGPPCTVMAVGASARVVAAATGAMVAVEGKAAAAASGKMRGRLNVAMEATARSLGLTIVRHGRHAVLVRPGQEGQAKETLRKGLHPTHKPARTSALVGLSDLRLRLLVLASGRSFAVLTDENGVAYRVRKGSKLGRKGSRVLAVDRRGVTVSWVDGRKRQRLLIPVGKEKESR